LSTVSPVWIYARENRKEKVENNKKRMKSKKLQKKKRQQL
jgi:hypothetical protein